MVIYGGNLNILILIHNNVSSHKCICIYLDVNVLSNENLKYPTACQKDFGPTSKMQIRQPTQMTLSNSKITNLLENILLFG